MKECIILAGGLGTRLQSVVKDVPKCMAEIAGQPFLKYLFDFLEAEKFDHIILALGHKSEIIIDWLAGQNYSFATSYIVEQEPLGTGGAIKLAFGKVNGERALVVNGDTFFNIDTQMFVDFHSKKGAQLSIALKPMTYFDRYGSVEIDGNCRIKRFNEKQYCEQGIINGGIYIIDKQLIEDLDLPYKFSFEKDLMEKYVDTVEIYGCLQDQYFIDIGIPSDFDKANLDFVNQLQIKRI